MLLSYHFTDWQTQAQEGEITCPKPQSLEVTEFRFIPRDFATRVCDRNHLTVLGTTYVEWKKKINNTHIHTHVYCWYMPRRPEKSVNTAQVQEEDLLFTVQSFLLFPFLSMCFFFFFLNILNWAGPDFFFRGNLEGEVVRSRNQITQAPPPSNCLPPS